MCKVQWIFTVVLGNRPEKIICTVSKWASWDLIFWFFFIIFAGKTRLFLLMRQEHFKVFFLLTVSLIIFRQFYKSNVNPFCCSDEGIHCWHTLWTCLLLFTVEISATHLMHLFLVISKSFSHSVCLKRLFLSHSPNPPWLCLGIAHIPVSNKSHLLTPHHI